MGLFGKLFGGGASPPPPAGNPPPPRKSHHASGRPDDRNWGSEFRAEHAQVGPFPKRLRLRAVEREYALVGSWQDVVLAGPDDYETARAQVMGGYYKQYGMYRLPDGTETIRWNEETWRALRESLQVLFDPAFTG